MWEEEGRDEEEWAIGEGSSDESSSEWEERAERTVTTSSIF